MYWLQKKCSNGGSLISYWKHLHFILTPELYSPRHARTTGYCSLLLLLTPQSSQCEAHNRYFQMKGGLSYFCVSQAMSVHAEKRKAGALRKGGLVLMRAVRQKLCVCVRIRESCLEKGADFRIQYGQCSAELTLRWVHCWRVECLDVSWKQDCCNFNFFFFFFRFFCFINGHFKLWKICFTLSKQLDRCFSCWLISCVTKLALCECTFACVLGCINPLLQQPNPRGDGLCSWLCLFLYAHTHTYLLFLLSKHVWLLAQL